MSVSWIDRNADEEPSRLVGGKYRLEERLGEGALGVVHRAVHVGLEKPFAVKLLKTAGAPASDLRARFRTEAVALGRLQHPHIVAVTDSGIDEPGGTPYLVMEVLDGAPLSGPLALERALPVLEQIAGAVDAAHEAGILHCDLKPGNVFLCADGVKVLDFGLAELLNAPAADERARMLGTPLYAAPELIRDGEASRASDVYSFGVLGYELLAGRPPFQGTVTEVLNSHLDREPPVPAIPPEVWPTLREALRKDPALRPRTAGEVVRRLRQGAAEAERRRWRSSEVPRRIGMASLLAASLAAAGLVLPWPIFPAAERRIDDLRVFAAPAKPPDPSILLVTFDEASLQGSPRSLADRADEVGLTLSRIFDAGARRVALDLLLPASWSASPAFADLLVRHPGDLTLAVSSGPGGRLVGADCMDPLTAAALGPRRAAGMFGFVNLDEDGDGIVRHGRTRFRDRSGMERPSWAAHAAEVHPADRDFWIDARIDWNRYARISWRQVSAALDRNSGQFRDRLVLVGGELDGSGDDYHRIPYRAGTGEAVSGLTLQALMVDTIAAGLPIREPGRIPVLVLVMLAAACGMTGILCANRAGPIAIWSAVAAGLYLGVSLLVFWWTGWMLPVTTPLLVALLGLVAAFVLRQTLPSHPEVSTP
ncbi:MAG TPA: protein kinase [Thermoanaerobaculia bacterium]|jgi:CHASE2 domain-containing sensor protein|nr:protein kinase [Thermoanaerobaculia bacterium]